MKVEKRLMMLVDMTNEEASECLNVSEKILFDGIVDFESPVVKMWMEAFYPTANHNRLLVAVTALPQRLLISYINHLENEVKP